MNAGGCNFCGCFTASDQCSGIGINARTSLNGQRFPVSMD